MGGGGERDLIDRRHLKESGISGRYERVVCVLSVNYTLQFINSRLASPSITSLGRFKRPLSVFFFSKLKLDVRILTLNKKLNKSNDFRRLYFTIS